MSTALEGADPAGAGLMQRFPCRLTSDAMASTLQLIASMSFGF